MEQVDSVSFSALIAGMLLCRKSWSSVEVVNMMTQISNVGIDVNDEDDDLACLYSCVVMDDGCSFRLKSEMDYDTVLSGGICVSEFLFRHTNLKILAFLRGNLNMDLECDSLNDLYDKRNCYLKKVTNSERSFSSVKKLIKGNSQRYFKILLSGVK